MPKMKIRPGFFLLVHGIITLFFVLPSFFIYNFFFGNPPGSILNPINIIILIILTYSAIQAEKNPPFSLNYSKQGKKGRMQRIFIFIMFLLIVISFGYILWMQYHNPELVDAFYNHLTNFNLAY